MKNTNVRVFSGHLLLPADLEFSQNLKQSVTSEA